MLYKLFLTDFPYSTLVCKATSLQDARKKAQEYIRIWHLDATVDRVEKMSDAEEKKYFEEHGELL